MIPMVFVITVIGFLVIKAPPGSYLETYIMRLRAQGKRVTESTIYRLENRFDLDKPVYIQYLLWIKGIILRGDFKRSFIYQRPNRDLLEERIPLTILITLLAALFQWVVAIPIGIYSAARQNSITDYVFTFIAFIGRSIPNFLLALVIIYFSFEYFGLSIGGLFSPGYEDAPWTIGKMLDLLKHLLIPIVVVGTADTAETMRVLRATLLDELGKDYVKVARAKGLRESLLILKHPVRVAINPIISRQAWLFPKLISGALITGIVLDLPTTGPLMYEALLQQDMYLAGSFIVVLSVATVISFLFSDILLAFSDPRIRFD